MMTNHEKPSDSTRNHEIARESMEVGGGEHRDVGVHSHRKAQALDTQFIKPIAFFSRGFEEEGPDLAERWWNRGK